MPVYFCHIIYIYIYIYLYLYSAMYMRGQRLVCVFL